MYKRIITLGIFVLIGFFIIAVYEPQQNSVAAAKTATGTIAYVVPNDTTGDQVWLIEPNGSNPRRIYSTGKTDPYSLYSINGLAWRPDAGELVFASDHENNCSWYTSDLYAIFADGSGYRRITNAPACAALANYPKGTVVASAPGANAFYQLYVQGASSAQTVSSANGGVVTFDDVADFGNVVQPVVAIDGLYRFMGPAVDVKAGQTVDAGAVSIYTEKNDLLGAYEPVWRSDGARIGYSFGCARLYGIADQPSPGKIGEPLINANGVTPCVMAWGSTASRFNQIVYFTPNDNPGIYWTMEGSSDAGILLVGTNNYDRVFDIQFLPDGSGIIYTISDNWADSANIYRYDFDSDTVTKLTFYTNQFARDFEISPDGQTIIYELADPTWGAPYGGASDLWTMRIDGSNPQLFKAGGAHPSWSINAVQLPKAPLKIYLPFIKR